MSMFFARLRLRPELRALACSLLLACACFAAAAQAQETEMKKTALGAGSPGADELRALRAEVAELRRRDEESRARMAELEATLKRLVAQQPASSPAVAATAPSPAAGSATVASRARATPGAPGEPGAAMSGSAPASSAADALDRALAASTPPSPTSPSAPTVTAAAGTARSELWSAPLGGGGAAQARLIDISFSTLLAGGGSSVGNDALGLLEAGGHDPDQNGFTLQQAELSLSGAVDPYFTGEAHIVGTPDGFELEEAFFTTSALPHGLQVEAGYSLTEFGLINPLHAHAWDWMDQPVINTRMFGGDGMRSPGVRVGWLMPLPFFSELHIGLQDANLGDYTPSFVGQEAIGGRPTVSRDVRGLDDLLWLARWNSSWDLTPNAALLAGFSALYGPNNSGPSADTWIYGIDAKIRWRPANNFRGWPFVIWQTEAMRRHYDAQSFTAGTDVDPSSGEFPNDLPGETLHDEGFYTQLLYGFTYGWAAGIRAEYATGDGYDISGGVPSSRNDDYLRDNRLRIAPLLVWHPTEFSRLRLQYDYDQADHLNGGDAHTIWIGAEVLYGKHGAHKY